MKQRLRAVPLEVPALLAVCLGFSVLGWLSIRAAFYWNKPPFEPRVWDVAAEANVWTWGNVAVLVTGAVLHGARAYVRWRDRLPAAGLWALSAVALLGLSLDDTASFHERMEGFGRAHGGGEGLLYFAWVIPGSAIALGLTALFAWQAWTLRRRSSLYLVGGVLFLFTGALGLEAVSGSMLDAGRSDEAVAAVYHVEEFFEAFGAALLLTAAVADIGPAHRAVGPWLSRR